MKVVAANVNVVLLMSQVNIYWQFKVGVSSNEFYENRVLVLISEEVFFLI